MFALPVPFPSDPITPLVFSILPIAFACPKMFQARRSALRALSATQTFRALPTAQRSSGFLGRRFYSSEKGHENHRSSDLPWYVPLFQNAIDHPSHSDSSFARMLGSIGLGGPMVVYLIQSGPKKAEHGDDHAHGHDDGHKESHEEADAPEQAEEKEPAGESESEAESESPKKEIEEKSTAGGKKDGDSDDAQSDQKSSGEESKKSADQPKDKDTQSGSEKKEVC